jgi:hypothetical protein
VDGQRWGDNVSDAASEKRHDSHEEQFHVLDQRMSHAEGMISRSETWRTGDELPHRGAEARILVIEKGAVMHEEMKVIAAEVVSAYLKSFRGILSTALPWVVFIVGVVLYITTGRTPPAMP